MSQALDRVCTTHTLVQHLMAWDWHDISFEPCTIDLSLQIIDGSISVSSQPLIHKLAWLLQG